MTTRKTDRFVESLRFLRWIFEGLFVMWLIRGCNSGQWGLRP